MKNVGDFTDSEIEVWRFGFECVWGKGVCDWHCAKSYNNHTSVAHQEKKETDAANTVLFLYSVTTHTHTHRQPHTVVLCHYQDDKAFASLVLFLFPVSMYLKLSECEFICCNCIWCKILQWRRISQIRMLFWQTMKSEVLIAVTLNKGDCCGML